MKSNQDIIIIRGKFETPTDTGDVIMTEYNGVQTLLGDRPQTIITSEQEGVNLTEFLKNMIKCNNRTVIHRVFVDSLENLFNNEEILECSKVAKTSFYGTLHIGTYKYKETKIENCLMIDEMPLYRIFQRDGYTTQYVYVEMYVTEVNKISE